MLDVAPVSHTPRVYSVGELNRLARELVEQHLPLMWVAGEISNFKRYDSGHCYFTLKDGNGQIRCAMFRRAAGVLDFTPRDGELVEVRGRLGVYATGGGSKAIVLEGFGRGNATPVVTAAATATVKKGIPVIMTSRCQRGRVKAIYGNGGGKTLLDGGVIFAGDLSGQKARVLVSVLLGAGFKGDRLRQEIEYFGG